MPPGKGNKNKFKENRQSRSRNTTPSSVVSGPVSAIPQDVETTAYLKLSLSNLMVPTNLLYEDIADRNGGASGIPDPRSLESLANSLRTLQKLASTRETVFDGAMRELVAKRKAVVEDEREREQELRERGEAEEKLRLKRAKEEEEDVSPIAPKFKKRKEMNRAKEDRPLAIGAHGVARQDGTDSHGQGSASPSSRKRAGSEGSSSLSPPSQLESPLLKKESEQPAKAPSPAPSESSTESHQPPKAASIPQYQTFGSNPLTFDDPTVYHVRDVTPEMSDSEKREIYSVASFPRSDLRDLIAGTIPDQDFSNAKPSNQVNFNTFQTYLDGYFRPLNDEDLQFLKERGDRVQPFLMPRRTIKTYQQIWAEEDGTIAMDHRRDKDKLPANEARGSIDEMNDAAVETEEVSTGPMMSRLLATMRFEHRPEEKEKVTNGNGFLNGDSANDSMAIDDPFGPAASNLFGSEETTTDRPSAAYFPESQNPAWKIPPVKQDYAQEDERLKAELRYLGLLGMEDEPDYDAHFDDEVGQRLRLLQDQLRETMVLNSARKSRLLSIAEDHMGYQEFSTIRDDLDNQVNQAFSKRNRMTGKGKKHHHLKKIGIATAPAGLPRPGIGDAARTLMDRRKRWKATIEPIFGDEVIKVRTANDTVFGEASMQNLIKEERERLEEELSMTNG